MKVPSLGSCARSLCSALILATSAFSISASARTPEIVMQKAQQLNRAVRQNAYQLRPNELDRLEAQLDRALQTVLGQVGGGPGGPGPGWPGGPGGHGGPGIPLPGGPGIPPRPRSECKLLGRGEANGWTYKHRISLNGQVMEGTDNLDTALARLGQYVNDQMCVLAFPENCRLGGRGDFAGWTYNFRALVGNEPMAASDNSATVLSVLGKLENAGVCQVSQPIDSCQLLGRGEFNGWTYNFRVAVGNTVMAGSDNYNTMRTFIETMKNSRVCF